MLSGHFEIQLVVVHLGFFFWLRGGYQRVHKTVLLFLNLKWIYSKFFSAGNISVRHVVFSI